MALITYDQAIGHLQQLGLVDLEEATLLDKMAEAEALVIAYCTTTTVWATKAEAWTDETTVPPPVRAGILLELGALYGFRGDDMEGAGPDIGESGLLRKTERALKLFRDPVLV